MIIHKLGKVVSIFKNTAAYFSFLSSQFLFLAKRQNKLILISSCFLLLRLFLRLLLWAPENLFLVPFFPSNFFFFFINMSFSLFSCLSCFSPHFVPS